jgi:folate-dependent phosphoribosylglycinamide formyltransferase PurN
MHQFRVALLTGNGLRHRYVAHRLAQATDLVAIVSEAKSQIIAYPELLLPLDERVINRHFAERTEVELRLLGEMPEFPATEVLRLAHGTINSPEVLAWLQARAADFAVLYGSSIIKPPLLDFYGDRMINLHLGLSPYYRGSGTNFWPLVYRQPECVGATIHLAVQRVDAGAILAQVRPMAEESDRAHELGTKTIMAALDLLPHVLSLYAAGQLRPQAQQLSLGRTFRQKDFNALVVNTMWQNFDTGMIAEYLGAAHERREKYPIVDLSIALN